MESGDISETAESERERGIVSRENIGSAFVICCPRELACVFVWTGEGEGWGRERNR